MRITELKDNNIEAKRNKIKKPIRGLKRCGGYIPTLRLFIRSKEHLNPIDKPPL